MVSVVVTVCYITCTLQMIRKSVETRDWMNTIEPRNVRAVMKRIVEDVTAIDTQVGQLYEEGVRKAHSSGVDRTVLFPRTFFVLLRNISNMRYSVSSPDETLCRMFDISSPQNHF